MSSLDELINRLSFVIREKLGTGEQAELRRWNPEHVGSPTFWRLLAEQVEGTPFLSHRHRERDEDAWAVVLAGLATLGVLHDPSAPAGAALREAGYSQARFERLLRMEGAALREGLFRLARTLAQKGQHVRWSDLADLLLNGDKEWGESIRRRLSRDFYREPKAEEAA